MEIESEFNNLKSLLEKDYVMIKKGKLWSFLGGAIALLVAAGFVNYGAAVSVVNGSAGQVATNKINNLLAEAKDNVGIIHSKAAEADKQLVILNAKVSQIENLEKSIQSLGNNVQAVQSDLSRRSRIAWKTGNNGTVSCQQYCNDAKWEGFAGECVIAIINYHDLNNCNSVPGGPTHCLCAQR